MILVDTSVWVGFFRGTETRVGLRSTPAPEALGPPEGFDVSPGRPSLNRCQRKMQSSPKERGKPEGAPTCRGVRISLDPPWALLILLSSGYPEPKMRDETILSHVWPTPIFADVP